MPSRKRLCTGKGERGCSMPARPTRGRRTRRRRRSPPRTPGTLTGRWRRAPGRPRPAPSAACRASSSASGAKMPMPIATRWRPTKPKNCRASRSCLPPQTANAVVRGPLATGTTPACCPGRPHQMHRRIACLAAHGAATARCPAMIATPSARDQPGPRGCARNNHSTSGTKANSRNALQHQRQRAISRAASITTRCRSPRRGCSRRPTSCRACGRA